MLVFIGVVLGLPSPGHAGVERWTPTGPPGAHLLDLLVDPEDPDTLYVTTFGIGTYKSSDRGESWVSLVPTYSTAFHVLAVAPDDGSIVYATTGDELIRSIDGGASWSLLSKDLPRPPIFLAIEPTRPSVLYAGTFGEGVFKSTDGGVTWSPINAGLPDLDTQVLEVDPVTPGTVYFGSVAGLSKSTDGGATWFDAGAGLPGGVWNLNIDPSDPTHLWIAVPEDGVFRSTDGGESWNAANHGLTDLSVYGLTMDPTNPRNLWAAARSELFRSVDGGESWVGLGGLPGVHALGQVFYDPRPPTSLFLFPLVSGPGPFKSTDQGATFRPANQGLDGRWVFCVTPAPSDPRLLYTAASSLSLGIAKSPDGGKTWSVFGDPKGFPGATFVRLAVDPDDPNTVFGGTYDSGMFKSTDGGQSWTETNQGITDPQIRALVVDPRDGATTLAGTAGGKIFESVDRGATWSDVSAGLADGWVEGLLFDPQDPTKTWAATAHGLFVRETGEAWTLVLDTPTGAIGFAPSDPDRRYATGINGDLWRSSDRGVTWTSFEIPDAFLVFWLAVDPADEDRLLVFTYLRGVLLSEDAGETWRPLNEGLLPWNELRDLAAAPTTPTTFYAVVDLGTLFVLRLAQPPSLRVTKTVGGGFYPGGTVVYRLTLTNDGDREQPDNPGDEMVDELPSELTLRQVEVTGGGGDASFDPGTRTVRWNGSIPGGGSVTIRIEAVLDDAAIGSVIRNQAQVFFDLDRDGTNEASALSIDPATGGATSFVVAAAIPALGPSGSWLLILLLAAAGLSTFVYRGRLCAESSDPPSTSRQSR